MKPILACVLATVAVVLEGCRELCKKEDYDDCIKANPDFYWTTDDCRKLQIIASCTVKDCCNHGEGGMTPKWANSMSEYIQNMSDALTAKEIHCPYEDNCWRRRGAHWCWGWSRVFLRATLGEPVFFGRGDVPLLMWMHTQGSVLAANAALVCEKVQDWETWRADVEDLGISVHGHSLAMPSENKWPNEHLLLSGFIS